MRVSKDVYVMPDGSFISLSQNEQVPQGAKIYDGYDYKNQYWVYKGERDTRTLEELRASMNL